MAATFKAPFPASGHSQQCESLDTHSLTTGKHSSLQSLTFEKGKNSLFPFNASVGRNNRHPESHDGGGRYFFNDPNCSPGGQGGIERKNYNSTATAIEGGMGTKHLFFFLRRRQRRQEVSWSLEEEEEAVSCALFLLLSPCFFPRRLLSLFRSLVSLSFARFATGAGKSQTNTSLPLPTFSPSFIEQASRGGGSAKSTSCVSFHSPKTDSIVFPPIRGFRISIGASLCPL